MNNNKILVTSDNSNFSSAIKYTFDLIFSAFGFEYRFIPLMNIASEGLNLEESLVISYGKDKLNLAAKYQIHIYASDFFGKNYLKPESMPKIPLKKYDDLPLIYCSDPCKLNGLVKKSVHSIETSVDIIASIFFMLSGYEEVISNKRDQYNRFLAKESLAFKQGFLNRPIVNEYIELLWKWIHELNPKLKRKPNWQDDKNFAVCVTHDVDFVKKYKLSKAIKRLVRLIFLERKYQAAFNYFYDYFKVVSKQKDDPYNTFEYMVNYEQKFDMTTSFYFMSNGDSKFDANYSITDAKVLDLIRMIEEKDCEIGLHPGFNSYLNFNILNTQKLELDSVVKNHNLGCRQHYLRWKIPDTWRIQEQTGLLYDSSIGFADHEGFRCGFCLPFKPFDLIDNKVIDIWELPITIMDRSLYNSNYRNLDLKESYDLIIEYLETIKKFNGVLVLIFHNTLFDQWEGWKEVYEKVIAYLGNQNVFGRSGREIIEWWKKRTSFC